MLSFLVSTSPGQTVTSTSDMNQFRGGEHRPPLPLPSLQDMLELSRMEGSERYKRPAPSSPSRDETMDSPSAKRSRFN